MNGCLMKGQWAYIYLYVVSSFRTQKYTTKSAIFFYSTVSSPNIDLKTKRNYIKKDDVRTRSTIHHDTKKARIKQKFNTPKRNFNIKMIKAKKRIVSQ